MPVLSGQNEGATPFPVSSAKRTQDFYRGLTAVKVFLFAQ